MSPDIMLSLHCRDNQVCFGIFVRILLSPPYQKLIPCRCFRPFFSGHNHTCLNFFALIFLRPRFLLFFLSNAKFAPVQLAQISPRGKFPQEDTLPTTLTDDPALPRMPMGIGPYLLASLDPRSDPQLKGLRTFSLHSLARRQVCDF
jgi:hypothetical protein